MMIKKEDFFSFSIRKTMTVPYISSKRGHLDKQVEYILKFLCHVHPILTVNRWHREAVEIRAIPRYTKQQIEEIKKSGKNVYALSCNIWHYYPDSTLPEDIKSNAKTESILAKFLKRLNGKPYCLYYSLCTVDTSGQFIAKEELFEPILTEFQWGIGIEPDEVFTTSEVVYKKIERKAQRIFKVNNKLAYAFRVLPLDFDNITQKDMWKYLEMFNNIGLEPSVIFTGHGYQLLFHLNDDFSCQATPMIFKSFTNLLLAKGFPVDSAIVDYARIFRLPHTFNCKALSMSQYDKKEVINTARIHDSREIYNVTEVFEKIRKLPTVIESIEPAYIPITAPIREETKKKVVKNYDIDSVKQLSSTELRTLYHNYIDINTLPAPIKKLLQGSHQGIRNQALMFIIPFLKNDLGYGLTDTTEILKIWGARCIPAISMEDIKTEVKRIYSYEFNAKTGTWTDELQRTYGYVDYEEIRRRNGKINIPNSFILDYKILNDTSVRIYFSLQYLTNVNEQREFNVEEICEIANIKERAFYKHIKELLKLNYIQRTKKNRRNKEVYYYYVNHGLYLLDIEGYTKFDNGHVIMMLKELSGGEFKVYTYIRKEIGNSNRKCYPMQQNIANSIGKKDQSTISKLTDSLATKRYLSKRTRKYKGMLKTTYEIFYSID